jgi:hypothetical protein
MICFLPQALLLVRQLGLVLPPAALRCLCTRSCLTSAL